MKIVAPCRWVGERARALGATVLAAFLIALVTALAPGGFGQGSSVVPVASAHDVVMNSQPADGSTVGSFPTQIVLEFSAIPLDSFNTVAVSNSDTHEVYFTTEPTFDQQFAVIRVPEGIDPGPGNYTIGFQITSSDGHATRGKTTFTVAGPSASVGDDATAAPDSGFPLWGWVVCGVLVLLVLAGVGIALTRT